MKRIYLDHAATTPVDPAVVETMLPFFTEYFGNPSSVYTEGRGVKKSIEAARLQIAKAINADPREIYFTGSGSEADNWAIKGIAMKNQAKGKHIITSTIEHHAVLHTCEYLEKQGFEVTYLPVDEYGLISLDDLRNAIRKDTILVTIMFANNEIGTIEPIKEIGEIVKEKGIIFHTDAVQALGNIPVDVKDLNVDLLSVSAHKIYGPKGIGALFIRKGVPIDNLIHGGAQERKKRAGTENTAEIVAFGKAAEMATEQLEENAAHMKKLRDLLIKGVMDNIPQVRLNGHPEKRLPGNVNFCFDYIEGESILLSLDIIGVAGSSGSACTSGSLDPSHVLLAIGLPAGVAHGSLRLTIGKHTTAEDINYVVDNLIQIIERLRKMSPINADCPIDDAVFDKADHHHH
ncbi:MULTISPECIES: cysteine desulfurase NifS [Acetobacterium]|uniref:Cysteine desulfurase IscS n=1 Tax=Acetobacterium wieringae TaxID=52694 RepID=A0A1F2PHD2_9FIRM|nr:MULTISPECIES: cysteine desulfurase NifS [Acetobacterium]MEA4806813.1 cysteine desulfurase NifS [Acetobacterium wieringae]OFV70738.1 cysteine desulfurase IscS [Acetobacterium wieringae]OXS27295.1 MAG: cysteine desulfurase NifS [Acetobacterium sp. MES1]URN83646.1 cysteine desulfurase NifS [Acetobacterium wieringae]